MFLNLTPIPKTAPKGKKKVQKRPKMWPIQKQKNRAVLPKPKLIDYIGSKNVFEPDPDFKNNPKGQKNSPKGPKKVQKRPQIWTYEGKR